MNDPKTTWEFDADLKKINAKLDKLEAEIKKTGQEGKKSGVEAQSGYKKLQAGIAKAAGSLAALYTSYQLVKSSIGTVAEFQKLETRINNLYLSAEKGGKAFEAFKEVASTTPFQLQDVVAAGVQLKSFGLDAEKTLKATVDLAAFMDTTATEAAYSLGRAYAAGAGAADILRERGVLNLIKSFSGITDLTKLKLPEFRKVLIATLQDPAAGIAGSTDALSKTYVGAVSNMKDAIDLLSESIGKKFLPGLTKSANEIERFVRSITPVETRFKKVTDRTEEQRIQFEALVMSYERLRKVQEKTKGETQAFKETKSKLSKIAKTYNIELGIESKNYESIAKALKNVREQLIAKGVAETMAARIKDLMAAEADAIANQIKLENDLSTVKAKLNKIREDEANAASKNTEKQKEENAAATGFTNIQMNVLSLTTEQLKITNDLNKEKEKEKKLDKDIADQKAINQRLFEKFNITLGDTEEGSKKTTNTIAGLNRELADLSVSGALRKAVNGMQQLSGSIKDLGDPKNVSYDYLINNLENAAALIEDFAGSMADAALNGENMGDAVVAALKRIAAQLAALSAAFAVLQIIPGGSAFTGGLLPFLGKGFGFSGPATASSAQPQVVVKSALPGQEFFVQSVNKQQNIYERLKF